MISSFGMNGRLIRLIAVSGVFLLMFACANTGDVQNKTGRLLCLAKEVDGRMVPDCLNALNAAPDEIARRVELFNDGKSRDQQIQCRKQKVAGSRITKWKCFRTNREGGETEIPVEAFDLFRKTNNREQ